MDHYKTIKRVFEVSILLLYTGVIFLLGSCFCDKQNSKERIYAPESVRRYPVAGYDDTYKYVLSYEFDNFDELEYWRKSK